MQHRAPKFITVEFAALAGVFALFFRVAYTSYLPTLVAREQLVDGNSKLMASFFQDALEAKAEAAARSAAVAAPGMDSICHMPANRMCRLFGSMARSPQPVFSSTNRVRCQVLPPSVLRKTPRSGCGP